MLLPNRESAWISDAKLSDYLLNLAHETGRSKATVLRGYGYSETSIPLLHDQLLTFARENEATETLATEYGNHFVVDGTLESPSGRKLQVRTVWIVPTKDGRPRLLTLYPTR